MADLTTTIDPTPENVTAICKAIDALYRGPAGSHASPEDEILAASAAVGRPLTHAEVRADDALQARIDAYWETSSDNYGIPAAAQQWDDNGDALAHPIQALALIAVLTGDDFDGFTSAVLNTVSDLDWHDANQGGGLIRPTARIDDRWTLIYSDDSGTVFAYDDEDGDDDFFAAFLVPTLTVFAETMRLVAGILTSRPPATMKATVKPDTIVQVFNADGSLAAEGKFDDVFPV